MGRPLAIELVLLPGDAPTSFRIFVSLRAAGTEDGHVADWDALTDWPGLLSSARFSIERDDGAAAPLQIAPDADAPTWSTLIPSDLPVRPHVPASPLGARTATFSSTTIAVDIRAVYSLAGAPGSVAPPAAAADLTPVSATEVDPGALAFGDQPSSEGWDEPPRTEGRGGLLRSLLPGPYAAVSGISQDRPQDLLSFVSANAVSFLANDALDVPAFDTFDLGARAPVTEWTNAATTVHVLNAMAEDARTDAATPDAVPADASASDEFHATLSALGDHPALLARLGLVLRGVSVLDVPEGPFGARVVVDGLDHPDATVSTPWSAMTRTGDRIAMQPRTRATPATSFAPLGIACESVDTDAAVRALLRLAEEELADGRPRSIDELPALRTAGLRLVREEAATCDLAGLAQNRTNRHADQRLDDDLRLHAEDVAYGARIDVLDHTTGRWRSLHERVVDYRVDDAPLLAGAHDESAVRVAIVHPVPGTASEPAAVSVVDDALATWDGWSLAAQRPGKAVVSAPDTEPAVRVSNEPLRSGGVAADVTARPRSLPRLRFGRRYRLGLRVVDIAGGGSSLDDAAARLESNDVDFLRFEPLAPPIVVMPPTTTDRTGESETVLAVRSGLDDDVTDFGAEPELCVRRLFPPRTTVELAERHGVFDSAVDDASLVEDAHDRASSVDEPLDPTSRDVGYLVDPLSAGATLWGLPGALEPFVIEWSHDDDGAPRAIELRLVAVAAGEERPPEHDATQGSITVFLAPGHDVTVHLASTLSSTEHLALPAMWGSLPDAERVAAQDLLSQGMHPMITPSVELRLVHATQRPTPPPYGADGVNGFREAGASRIAIEGGWPVDPWTTGSVEVTASWADLSSDRQAPTGSDDDGNPVVVPVEMPRTSRLGAAMLVPYPASAEAPDTEVWLEDAAVVDPGHAKAVTLTLTSRYTSRHPDFFPRAFAVAEPGAVPRLAIDGEPYTLTMRSAARPVPIAPTRVLPLIVRRRFGDVIEREGGWIRVHVGTEWFLSGPGEQAVVLALSARAAIDDPLPDAPFRFSRVGLDPGRVRDDPFPSPPLSPEVFGPAEEWIAHCPPESVDDLLRAGWDPASDVLMRPRPVSWDESVGEWFFDVRVTWTGSTDAMASLVVARDQPHTMTGAGLDRCSVPTRLDPIPLLADRRLTLVPSPGGFTLGITGPTPPVARRRASTAPGAAWHHDHYVSPDSTTVFAYAQELVAPAADELIAWRTYTAWRINRIEDRLDGTTLWRTTLYPDADDAATSHRIVVVEWDAAASVDDSSEPGGFPGRPVLMEQFPITGRIRPPVPEDVDF